MSSRGLPSAPRDAVIVFDDCGRIAFWSDPAAAMFGYDADEVGGCGVELLAADENRERLHDAIAAAQRVGASEVVLFRAVRKDGTRFAASMQLQPSDGDNTRVCAAEVQDVTLAEQWATEHRLLYGAILALIDTNDPRDVVVPRLLEVLAKRLDCSAATFWMRDPEQPSRLVVAYSYGRRLARETTLPRGVGLPGRVWANGRAEWTRSAIGFPVAGGRAIAGVIELFSTHFEPPAPRLLDLLEEAGVSIGLYLARERAVTPVRRAEERMRELARSYAEAQQFAHIGSFERVVGERVAWWSDELYRIYGLEPQSMPITVDYMLGRVVEDERERVRAAIEETIRTGKPLDLKFRILDPEGRERVLRARASLSPAYDGQPARIIGKVLDITADEAAARDRLELQRQLDEVRRMASLGQLAATMAHEFQNVLMSIESFTAILRRRGTHDDAVDRIGDAVRRGKSVTDDLLRFTRPAPPLFEDIDVARWLAGFRVEAAAITGGVVSMELEPGLRIRGDIGQLNRVLVNLLLNARAASAPNAPMIVRARRAAEEMCAGMGMDCVDLSVADYGSGIPPEIRDRIFDPLFTTKRGGTGLGLTVVHQVIRAHGGTVRVHSEVGAGSEFHLILPLVAGTSNANAQPVLLVEDDPSIAAGLEALLEAEDIRTVVVHRGAEVVHMIERVPPEAVVLDVGLPDMSGTEVYEAISARWPDLPVIFVTGHVDEGIVERHLIHPHVALLRKPFELAQLLAALAQVRER